MAPPLALVWDLIARDNASATFSRVGNAAEANSRKVASFNSVLGKLFAIGVAVDIGSRMVSQAEKFQKAMLLIQTQAGASSQEVSRMSSAVLKLAGQVATAPDKLATSLYHVESIGLRGAKALDLVRIAAEGAKVGHADLEQTTNALTAAVASGIPGVQNFAQAMGQLNAIVGAGDMKMQDLNDALSSGVLTVVKQYGLSLNDVGAALATFGDNNIRGANAATMLRMAVQALAVPARGGEKTLADLGLTSEGSVAALAKLHLTVGSLATDLQTGGLNKALLDLKQHLDESGVSGAEVGTVLTQTFGKRAGPGLQVLIGQLDRFESKIGAVRDGSNRFGSDWKATQHNAAFQFDKLRASLDAFGIEIGTHLLPLLATLAQALAFAFNNQPIRDTALAILGVWAAVKTLALGVALVSKISDAFVTLRLRAMYAADGLRAIAAGERAVTAAQFATGIAVIGVAFYELGSHISKATEANNSFAHVMDNSKKATDSFRAALDAANGAIDENVLRTVGMNLQQDGLAAKAAKAGISLDQLIAGVTGSDEAMARLIQTWRASGKPSGDTITAIAMLHLQFARTQKSAQNLAAAVDKTSAALNNVPKNTTANLQLIETLVTPNSGPRGSTAFAFAAGGVLPGYSPGVDNIRIPSYMFSGGEGILVPEATRALGGAAGIRAINAKFSNRVSMPRHFAGGGMLTTNGQFDKIGRSGMTVEHMDVNYFGEPPVVSQTLPQVQRSLAYQLGT